MDVPEIPGYRIQAELGRGARGVVYRAQRGGVSYAIKVELEGNDRSLLSCGAILACMRHPGLPEVVEVGEAGGRPYLVREYVPGYSLAAELETGPLPENELIEIAKTIAGALDQVHRHGLIHRDVKPSNIMLSRSGGARLIDFGFATNIHASKHDAVGTYLYAAPEQSGVLDAPIDQRSDLYALGTVLFHCATGRPPYESESTASLLQMHAAAPVPRLEDHRPELSPALGLIIEKLLAKDPRDRYQTGHSLLADLRALNKLNQRLAEEGKVSLGDSAQELTSQFHEMVGREAELEELLAALERTSRGDGQSVLVEGEGGSGKSFLAREFLRKAVTARPLVLEARCEQGQPPYAPMRAWAEGYFQQLPGLPAVQRKFVEDELVTFLEQWGTLLGRLSPVLARGQEHTAALEAGDRFLDATAAFFLQLARMHGCLILLLDDAHHLDEGGHQVLRRVRTALEEVPILLLATARSSLESRQGLELYLRSARPSVRLALEPLGNPEIELLVYSYLGSRPVDAELVHQVAVRSHGNPFATAEYVRAMLSSGVVLPSLEGWRVDHQGLQSLRLPADVLELVLQRAAMVSPEVRALMTLAAVYGSRFSLAGLAAVVEKPEAQVQDLLEVAVQFSIVEQAAPGSYLFVHDRIREAFLGGLEDEARRELHRRVAQGLEKLAKIQPELAYAVARHYALGLGQGGRVYETNLSAGLMALRDFAFEDAYQFLTQACRSAEKRTEWMEPLSLACERTNRVEEAIKLLTRLLEGKPDSLRRAQYLHRVSKLRLSKLDRAQARDGCRQALAAIGKPVLDHPLWNGVAAAYYFGLWLLADFTRIGRAGTGNREREETVAELYQSYSEGEYFEMHYPKMLEMGARACLSGHRIGPSPQMITSYANMMIFFGMLRKSKIVERRASTIQKLADQLGDPVSNSHLQVMRHVALHIAGECGEVEDGLDRVLTQHGHLTEAWVYLIGVADLAWVLMMRGYQDRAWAWVQRGIERCKLTSSPAGVVRDLDILSCYAISCLAVLGRPGEALEYVERLREKCTTGQADRSLEANYLGHLLMLHRETGELTSPMVETGEQFLKLKMLPALTPLHRRHFFVLWAYANLDRCQRGEASEDDYARLDQAMKLLKKTANRVVIQAHYLTALGAREHLAGRHHRALEHLSKAQDLAALHDAPWVTFEVGRWRSRVLSAMQKFDAANREAARAYQLAVEMNWPSRARAAAREFALGRSSSMGGSASLSAGSRRVEPGDAVQARLQRQLSALLNLSLASARVLRPYEQARAVLDELIKILNAERAYLFMLGDEGIGFVTGRDRTGETLSAPTGYSRTVVDTVHFSREPVVIAGTEEGAALGAVSVVAHDLRSIICAPLFLREQFVGVVYLDNRLARGVFTDEDIEILNALSSHIAVAMETARAARLEVEVQSERSRRELADRLSEFTSALSSTLDTRVILDHLLETMAHIVPFVRASLWLVHEQQLQSVMLRGFPEWLGTSSEVDPDGLAQAVVSARPVLEPSMQSEPGFPNLTFPAPFSWIASPLLSEGRVIGVLTLSAAKVDAFTDYEAEVAFTFCNQAGIALANASMFQEIDRLATTDHLTGVYNRRRFWELAELTLEQVHEVSAIMLDVDHFKRFNDTYGHAVGDEVLRLVSWTLQDCIGEAGLLARYGGEEFCILLPEQGLEQAIRQAEAVRQAVERTPLEHEKGPLGVTLSLGVATLQQGETLDHLLARADAALYQAKSAGRNRVAVGEGEAQASSEQRLVRSAPRQP
ncbi:MAG: hypothetical protein AMXMBFR33_19490 [Candidatus Xenobia bacterium]